MYNVHLPIMLESERQAVYRERKKKKEKDGPDPFCEKTINVLLKWTLFLAGPHIQALQISYQSCSNVDIKDSWAHQILQWAHKSFKWPIKIWIFACI